MNPRESAQWIEAAKWDAMTLDVPTIVSRMIHAQLRKAMRNAKPFKPAIKMPKGSAAVTMPKLKKELDRVFSLFIRQRDTDTTGMGICVTCPVRRHKSQLQAGHYVPRQFLATRWEEENAHAQCGACNGFRGGEPEKMAAYIDSMYGDGTAMALTVQKTLKFRATRDWMEVRIKHYRGKIGEI